MQRMPNGMTETAQPYIFISYDHEDKEYVHRLAEALADQGFEYWIDDRIDYGSQWPRVIQQHLDGCAAFIVVMTPRSYQSDWVQNELSRAQAKDKPIFPLLLEDDVWLAVQSTQYVDVRDKALPGAGFFERLARVVPRAQEPGPPGRQVFISYDGADRAFAQGLARDLEEAGIPTWIAPDSIQPGEGLLDAIERGLRASSHIAFVLTAAAVGSRRVKMEINAAIRLYWDGQVEIIILYAGECQVPLLLGGFKKIDFLANYDAALGELKTYLGEPVVFERRPLLKAAAPMEAEAERLTDPILLTTRAAGELTQTSSYTVRRWARERKVDAHKRGGTWLISPESLESYINEVRPEIQDDSLPGAV
jgi:excisionase family DNA binding protein